MSRPMEIVFPGGDRVEARLGDLAVTTDQNGTAPTPFDLFLASIATCTGLYVARFCRARGIPTEGLRLRQRSVVDPETGMVGRIELIVEAPQGFPGRYREAVQRAAALCSVKKHLERPPRIEVDVAVPVS